MGSASQPAEGEAYVKAKHQGSVENLCKSVLTGGKEMYRGVVERKLGKLDRAVFGWP